MTNPELLTKLKAEIEKAWLEYECYNEDYDKVAEMRWNEFEKVARYFYELGKQSGSSEILKDLEEAAEKYAYTGIPDEMKCVVKPVAEQIIKNFIAGAKWQKEQDDRLVDIIYQQGIEKGKDDMKEQMLKEAVEGEVRKDGTIGYFEFSNEQQFHSLLEQFQDCDKVRVIIVKEDEK